MKRRVAITGVGAVSAAGWGMAPLREAVRHCRSCIASQKRQGLMPDGGVGEITLPLAAVPDAPNGNAPAPMMDPFARFAVFAAHEALTCSGLAATDVADTRTAVVLGTGNGGDQARELAWDRIGQGRRPHPLTVGRVMCSAGASAVSIDLGITGPVLTLSTACASSAHAIGQAFRLIQHGAVDRALAGGAEELPGRTQMCAWQQMRVLSAVPCLPFAEDRRGISLGEGAAVLCLEAMDIAEQRGATILAELSGFGSGADAQDWFEPKADGLLRCMRAALDDASVTADRVGYVNAHATGTLLGDAVEAEALRQLLHGTDAAVSSTKGIHGHAIGASGALEAAITVQAMAEGWLPGMPAASSEIPGLRFAWQHGPVPETWHGDYAISNSFGFGGLNGALVFRRASKQTHPAQAGMQGAGS